MSDPSGDQAWGYHWPTLRLHCKAPVRTTQAARRLSGRPPPHFRCTDQPCLATSIASDHVYLPAQTLRQDLSKRMERWTALRRALALHVRLGFKSHLPTRNLEGQLIFDHGSAQLTVQVGILSSPPNHPYQTNLLPN